MSNSQDRTTGTDWDVLITNIDANFSPQIWRIKRHKSSMSALLQEIIDVYCVSGDIKSLVVSENAVFCHLVAKKNNWHMPSWSTEVTNNAGS